MGRGETWGQDDTTNVDPTHRRGRGLGQTTRGQVGSHASIPRFSVERLEYRSGWVGGVFVAKLQEESENRIKRISETQ